MEYLNDLNLDKKEAHPCAKTNARTCLMHTFTSSHLCHLCFGK